MNKYRKSLPPPGNPSIAKQKGAAIIIALFVTALVAIASIAMIERLGVDLRRTELLLNDTQANLYAEGSIAWAVESLNDNWKKKKPEQIIDKTPIQSPVNVIENAQIESLITDEEGLFNLNNLSRPEYLPDFIKLMQLVHPKISSEEAQGIALALQSWVSGANNNILDDYYLKQVPAYRAPHRFMLSISELRLVKGMTPELFRALSLYVTALPEVTKININSAPAFILMTLNHNMSLDAAKRIEIKRKTEPFQTVQSFLQYDVLKNNPVPENKISTTSSYFLVKTTVRVSQQSSIRMTLLHRILKNSQPYEEIVWQSKGTQ